jgi:DnaJ-class molecular chaperone
MPATKICDRCLGDGTVPRPDADIRKLGDGTRDPTDLRRKSICDKCGGGGRVPENYTEVRDWVAGYIADQI